ncbi:MAG: translation initiation factor 2 [Oscillospiraceae bacterium]|nr:translation initiation factor 2 [Oscillospiraceae bacterium]
MVKGLSRRVIVVKAPDERIFEQAIFIIREDYAAQSGLSESDLLAQARCAADEYLNGCGAGKGRGLWRRLRPPLYAAAGAAATAAACFAFRLTGV